MPFNSRYSQNFTFKRSWRKKNAWRIQNLTKLDWWCVYCGCGFVPPAADKISDLLSDFEKFLNNEEINVPNLIKIAIAHYQFETIHPFLDGNGRMGRLLITLFLVSKGILDKPLLYLSAFFEKNRSLYYDKLTITREKNDLNQWIKFFLVGIIETAEEGTKTLEKIMQIKAKAENKILSFGRRAESAHKLLEALFSKPMVSIKGVQTITNLSPKAAGELVNLFVDNGLLQEVSNQQRNRAFAFTEYLDLFIKQCKKTGETGWLTQAQLVDLYGSSKANISERIKHISEEEELEEDSVVRNFRTTAADGKSYQTKYFNLDMIISLGYRIKSKIATQFRQWATKRLNEYI